MTLKIPFKTPIHESLVDFKTVPLGMMVGLCDKLEVFIFLHPSPSSLESCMIRVKPDFNLKILSQINPLHFYPKPNIKVK